MPSGWTRVALTVGAIAGVMWLERRRPLRKPVEPGVSRIARNVAVGAITAATVSAIERPVVTALAAHSERRKWGLTWHLPVSARTKTALAIVLMDYTLYWWHVLLHRVPFLWRLHEPHHIDRDLDLSTAVRFHFTEFLASIPWRCAQIVAIGVAPETLKLWQRLTLAEVLFHHSNVQLPRPLERALARVLVTPRMHGLHHSVLRDERDSNFSSGLTAWDELHRTARIDWRRDDVVIGLPEYQCAPRVELVETLTLPFKSASER